MKSRSPSPPFLLRLALLALALLLGPTVFVAAQSGGIFNLEWNTIDSGGGSSTGGVYNLFGIIGQSDTGSASGGVFDLHSGFVPGGALSFPTPTPTATASPTLTTSATPTATLTPTPTDTDAETPTASATATSTSEPPPAPTLLKPKNRATVVTRRPTLDWTDSPGAVVYEVELRKVSTGGLRVALPNPAVSQLRTPNLTRGAKYYWRVQACAAFGCSPWTAWRWFKVK